MDKEPNKATETPVNPYQKLKGFGTSITTSKYTSPPYLHYALNHTIRPPMNPLPFTPHTYGGRYTYQHYTPYQS